MTHILTQLYFPTAKTLYDVSRPLPAIDEVRVKELSAHSRVTYIDSGESPPRYTIGLSDIGTTTLMDNKHRQKKKKKIVEL